MIFFVSWQLFPLSYLQTAWCQCCVRVYWVMCSGITLSLTVTVAGIIFRSVLSWTPIYLLLIKADPIFPSCSVTRQDSLTVLVAMPVRHVVDSNKISPMGAD